MSSTRRFHCWFALIETVGEASICRHVDGEHAAEDYVDNQLANHEHVRAELDLRNPLFVAVVDCTTNVPELWEVDVTDDWRTAARLPGRDLHNAFVFCWYFSAGLFWSLDGVRGKLKGRAKRQGDSNE